MLFQEVQINIKKSIPTHSKTLYMRQICLHVPLPLPLEKSPCLLCSSLPTFREINRETKINVQQHCGSECFHNEETRDRNWANVSWNKTEDEEITPQRKVEGGIKKSQRKIVADESFFFLLRRHPPLSASQVKKHGCG